MVSKTEDAQRLMFMIKLTNFLRLADALRNASRHLIRLDKIEKRYAKNDTSMKKRMQKSLLSYLKAQANWIERLVEKNTIENFQRMIVIDKLTRRVQSKMIKINLKIRMIQAFFRVCLIKKYQSYLEMEWKLDVYIVKVGGNHRRSMQTATCQPK